MPMKYTRPLIGIILPMLLSVFSINQTDLLAADHESRLTIIQEKLKEKLFEYKETGKKEKVVAKKLEAINRNINKKEQELKYYGRQLSQTQSEINELNEEINLLSAKLESNMQYLRDVIVAFYKQQYDSSAFTLLSATDYQDLIQRMKYASLIAHYDSSVINQYAEEIKRINEKKDRLEALQENLKSEEENAREKKKKLYEDGLEKEKLLAELKAKRAAYEQTVRELEQSSQKVQLMLAGIESKALPKSIAGKGFNALKGRLSWPIDGEILTPYGIDKKIELNTSALKSGIEIKARPETIVEAVAGGRVVHTDTYGGYEKVVIVDHGEGYHTLYGNLSEVSLEKGNIVIQGSEIGKTRISNTLKVPTLYFEIRYKGRPVDPMDWLQKKIRKAT